MSEEAFVFPTSFAQQRLWFLDQLTPGSSFYNLFAATPVRWPLNVSVLERVLNEIVRRHESLRTTFAAVDGQPVQIIAPQLQIPLPVVDLRHLPPEQREAEALRLATEEAHRPFDLTRGPLIRTQLLQLGASDYVFLLTMHHIISDGWSMGVFSRELSALYSAFAMGQPSPLPDLSIQYADFAVWQRQWLQGAVLEEQLGYWREQLADLPALQLPTDRPRPTVQSYRGAYQSLTLPPSLNSSLKSLSQREGVTLFMTLLAAFQALLHRYTRQDEIAVGTYIANRNRAEMEDLIGFFVNSLVLRTDLSGDPSFRELLRRVQSVALGAYGHQDLPFAKLVEEIQPERDLSRNPLFQVVLQLVNVPTTSAASEPGQARLLDVPWKGTSLFDIVLSLAEGPTGLSGGFEYSTDLFDAETIRRMGEHLRRLLEAVVADPDRRISEIPLLAPEERRRLVVEWNATGENDERYLGAGIVSRFEARAAQHPEEVAFRCEGEALRYGELNRRANRLANRLRALGIGPDRLVGVCLERSLDVPVALLGILKAGGVYLPLDPGYPRERLAFILEDAGAAALLTRRTTEGVTAPRGAHVICLDGEEGEALRHCSERSREGVSAPPGDLAYVIYTSGSTGKPKGVAVEHRQILNRLAWMWRAYPFGPGEVGCQKTALNFVDSLWELLGPLLQGVPTVILPDRLLKDPPALVEALAEQGVTRIWLVPSLLRLLLDQIPDLQERLPRLRFWVSSGEVLPVELFLRFKERMPRSVLYNLYGTSEVWDATWYDPSDHEGREGAVSVPIGRPIANSQAYVLDARGQPVPVGVPGELCIGGDGLARGYLNRPELTAEKFIADPFSGAPGARLYRTGDLARWLSDGNLEFLGRIDQQVKIRGYRVEPGEIEATLLQHPAVRAAAVIAHEDQTGGKRLVAYVVSLGEPAPSHGELRGFLQGKLPDYMIPSVFVPLSALPLSPNGKVDRRALPAPDPQRPELEQSYVAARTPVEEALAGLFAGVLSLERVGVHDNFFTELGGHSLLATQLISRVRDTLNIELPLRSLFEAPTVAELSLAIEEIFIAEIEALSDSEARSLVYS
jgi:amino acid adenylation domain-containing protein